MRTPFIAPDYQASNSDVVVDLRVIPPERRDFHECLHYLLSELCQGFAGDHLNTVPCRAFDLQEPQQSCKIAFHEDLFEEGNMNQILAWLMNGFCPRAFVQEVEILNLTLSKRLQASFPGPQRDIHLLRKLYEIDDRPLSAAELRVTANRSPKHCLQTAYHLWTGGIDIVHDSPQLTSLSTNDFEERVSFISKERENCKRRLKKKKGYIPNVTASNTTETLKRVQFAAQEGLDMVSLNCSLGNVSLLSSVRELCNHLDLFLLINPIGEQMLTQGPYRFAPPLSYLIFRLCGADMVSVQAPSGEHYPEIATALSDRFLKQAEHQGCCIPVCSDKLHPGQIQKLTKAFGYDIIMSTHNSIYQHPDGIQAGAEAFQVALESINQGIDLISAADHHPALKKAQPVWAEQGEKISPL